MLSTYEKREFEITYKDVPTHFRQKTEMTIDDVKEFFHFDVEECKYQFPFIDERKLLEVTEFMGRKTVPAKNFFWFIQVQKTEKMFGIVEVLFKIIKITVKSNEERFENMQVVFKDETNYYYDYAQEQYVQINKKAKQNDNLDEYKSRVQLLEKCFERLEKENNSYLLLLQESAKHLTKKRDMHNAESFFEYFQDYLAHYEMLKDYFPLKILYDHTDKTNYRSILAFFGRVNQLVRESVAELKTGGITGDLRDVNVNLFNRLANLKKEIVSMFQLREEIEVMRKRQQNPYQRMDGFYKLDKDRLYENLVQIEIEKFFKNNPGTKEQRKQEYEELHKNMLESSKKVQQKETENYEVLSAEQLLELSKLTGSKKNALLLSYIKELIKQGKIKEQQLHVYLNLYK
ncbi:hypothetical protein [Bacillus mycoides]|uniref:hypothetical protein n=2 Tax=Bacillus mycoides TaxID=1405 RepID=UPI0010428366|nr:hypothetical protein [Bacillus mycoides]